MVSIGDVAPIDQDLTGEQVADPISATEASSTVKEPIVGPEDVQPPAVPAPVSGPSQSPTTMSDRPPLRNLKGNANLLLGMALKTEDMAIFSNGEE